MRVASPTLIGLLLVATLGCSSLAEPTPIPTATPLARMSRIAFVSERDGNWEVYVMNADGSNPRNLTNNPAPDGHPSWSPDGKKLAFHSERDGNRDIYVMNSDGTGLQRLTEDPAADHSPAWSPDGSKIAFVSDRIGRTHIWLMDSDGSDLTDLTPRHNRSARWPAWSPNGETIAYIFRSSLWYMSPDGRTGSLVIDADDFVLDGFFVGTPDWSPDGENIALLANFRDRDGLVGRLYTAESEEGYNFREVLPLEPRDRPYVDQVATWPVEGPDERPTWSPDGKKIVFASLTDGDWEIWVADVEAQTATRLTEQKGTDSFAAWEPVGLVPAELGVVLRGDVPAATPTPTPTPRPTPTPKVTATPTPAPATSTAATTTTAGTTGAGR